MIKKLLKIIMIVAVAYLGYIAGVLRATSQFMTEEEHVEEHGETSEAGDPTS